MANDLVTSEILKLNPSMREALLTTALGEIFTCAVGDSHPMRVFLKEETNNRGWKGSVGSSQNGCLGLFENGPNPDIS